MNPADDFPYELVEVSERVGAQVFTLTVLADFERTVADLYTHLKGRGSAQLREDLCPMFGVIWSAARALAERVAAEGEALCGRSVLELGCGLALPSLVAARLGASVVSSDQHPHTEAFLTRNLLANRVGGVRYRSFDWRGTLPGDVVERSFDYVLASDVLFARELPPVVAATFDRFLGPDGHGLLADPGRAYLQEFADAAVARGLSVEVDVVDVPGRDDEIFLVALRR